MVSRNFCLAATDIGGFLSVPSSVRLPVVKKKAAPNDLKSAESNILPSLVHSTWKPCFLPISVATFSQMLRLPLVRFTTWCSKPEDLVKTSNDFEEGSASDLGSEIAAPARAV